MTNEMKLEIIAELMSKQGVTNYTTHPGANGSINVCYGRVSAYYIFNEEKLVDVWID